MKTESPLLGIFDSGVGGFSVLKEIRKVTDADILYFGDCARAPYGNRSESEIVLFIKELFERLQTEGVTHFVSACNSMSVVTTEKLLLEVGIPKENYIDMIDAVELLSFSDDAKVLIIATKATIDSGVYQNTFLHKNIYAETFIPSALAGEIETDNKKEIEKTIIEILSFATSRGVTHILYACTHYPLVDSLFKDQAKELGWKGGFIDPSMYVARLVATWNLQGSRKVTLETSKETKVFKEYSERVW